MKRKELARKVARSEGVPTATAQDQVDELVGKMIRKLRSGKPVTLPGVGDLLALPRKASSKSGKPVGKPKPAGKGAAPKVQPGRVA